MWVLGIQTLALMLPWQALYPPRHLHSPSAVFAAVGFMWVKKKCGIFYKYRMLSIDKFISIKQNPN